MEHLDFCLLHSQKSCFMCHSILILTSLVLSLILACSVTLSVPFIQPFPIPCVPEKGFSLVFCPETHHLPTAAHGELFVFRFDLRAGILRQGMEYLANPCQDPVSTKQQEVCWEFKHGKTNPCHVLWSCCVGETQSLEITVHGVHETWNFMFSSSSSSDRMLWESSGELRCCSWS